jgi:GT2 family glycosyltransferase
MISLIIPTTGTNQNYTNNLIRNIKDLYPNKDEVEIILEENDKVTLGINYNNAVVKAKGDKIILLHNDMVIKKGFIETMDKHIVKDRITTYTRIEPPIYNDIYPGKVIDDFGSDLDVFNESKFNNFNLEESLIDGGSQLFFGCMKEDYIGIDGYTFKMFCEDDDLHLRYKLAGFEHKVSSAHVYHFVSKTSRTTKDYQQIEFNSNRNFIRKWGNRSPKVKYNVAYVVKNCNSQLLEVLEPWCDRIYIEDDMQVLTSHYIEQEQPNTSFDLSKRILCIGHNDPIGENDIVVEFDATQLTQQSFQLLQQLPDIIKESGEIGEFELEIFKINIQNIWEYQNDLVYLNK